MLLVIGVVLGAAVLMMLLIEAVLGPEVAGVVREDPGKRDDMTDEPI